MRHAHAGFWTLVLGFATLCSLTACGGGGGSTPDPTPDAFSGAYSWASWSGNITGPEVTTEWGSATADGFGVMGGMIRRHATSGITGPLALTQMGYTLDAARALRFDGSGSLSGSLASDGSVALLGVAAGGNHPGIAVLLRQDTPFTLSQLSGDYHLCGLAFSGGNDAAIWGGTVTFDGAGNVTALRFGVNNNGVSTPPVAPVPGGTYAVGAAGDIVWTSPGETLSGAVGGGGEIVVFCGAIGAPGPRELFVLIKKATTASNATFTGPYQTIGLTSLGPPSTARYATATRKDDADGIGTLSAGPAVFNIDGTLGPLGGGSTATYLIAADGEAMATGTAVSGAQAGGISQSGRYVVLAGGTAGDRPFLQLWIR